MLKKQIIVVWAALATIFVYEYFRTHQFHWSIIGVAILATLIIFLSSKRQVLKIIGEYPHSKRSKKLNVLTWILTMVLSIPFVFYLLDQLSTQELDINNFAIFIIVPILLGVSVGLIRIPSITTKTQSGLISVIKKFFSSMVLFIIFIPFFVLTNKRNIDINSLDFHIESLFNGFVVWSMVFCFYAALFLFVFALVDSVLVVKDLSIRRVRKPKKSEQ